MNLKDRHCNFHNGPTPKSQFIIRGQQGSKICEDCIRKLDYARIGYIHKGAAEALRLLERLGSTEVELEEVVDPSG